MAFQWFTKWGCLFHILICLKLSWAFETCPSGYTADSDTCYKLSGSCMDWDSAKATCQAEQAFLFTVDTDRLFNLAQRIISGASGLCDDSIWLGGRRSPRGLIWEHDGSGMNIKYFSQGQPDGLSGEDCVSIRRPFANHLNDHICSIQKKFICQACQRIEHCVTVNCPTPESTKCAKCQVDNFFYKRTHEDTQCEEMCSWNNNFCWPGTCGDDLTKNCVCSTGFRKDTASSHTLCQPTSKPAVDTCELLISGQNREQASAPNNGSLKDCASKIDFYGNFQPETINYTMTASFTVSTPFPKRPNYIKEETFGVTDMQIVLRHISVNGRIEKKAFDLLQDTVSTENVKSPATLIGAFSNQYTLRDGDRLCLRFIASGGGYLKYINIKDQRKSSGPISYSKQSVEKGICYRFDSSSPQHCSDIKNCTMEPIHIESRITRRPDVKIFFSGWFDPIPAGGSPSSASNIKSFEVTVREVLASPATAYSFVDYTKSTQSTYLNSTNIHSLSINLSSNIPKLFCIILEARDTANNVRQARRFVLVDRTSNITTTLAPISFRSASSETLFKWQTHHGDLCLAWKGHFTNTFYSKIPLLKPIRAAPNNSISGVYEQLLGDIPVNGTQNIDGITRFVYSWNLNNGTFTTETEVPEFQKQELCLNTALKDGQTYVFKVTAIDIVNNTYEETRTVHIDATAPHINNIGLVKNGYEGLFAYGDTGGDMSKLHISFEALDPHSGIEEIQWSLGTTDSGSNLVTGHMSIQTIKENCTSVEFCYKPTIGSFENYKYHLWLNSTSIVNIGNNIGDHNRNYYFTLKVTNRAKLSNIEHLDIILDKSPPEIGVVNEGPASSPDIDYINGDTFQTHWHGFIDHESGIKLYRIGVATKCLTSPELSLQRTRSEMIMYTELPWTHTSLRVKTNYTGKLYVSVVALNNALEPSQPTCSDGITRDTSPPELKNISFRSARWSESIACHKGLPWLMHSTVSKVLLTQSNTCATLCTNETNTHELPAFLPTISLENNDTEIIDFMCSTFPSYKNDNTIYVPNDHISLSWDIQEAESQMQDYLIGFGNHPSEKLSPGILAYQSTNHKRYFSKAHQGIGSSIAFYIFIKAVNKAGSESVATIGPVLVDETPPLVKGKPVVQIHEGVILIGWQNDSFYDQEQMEPINHVFIQIKTRKNGNPVTPLLEWRVDSSKSCSNHNFSGGCVSYPLYRVQSQDTVEGLDFFVSLYPYNNAGHSARSDSDMFNLPSSYSPGHGTVLDINPNSTTVSNEQQVDIDSHATSNTLCFSWKGFYHHEKMTFAVGIGTERGKTDVIQYRNIGNSLCLTSKELQYFVKYFVGIRASCSGGQTESFSDGVVIVNRQTLSDTLTLYPDIRKCNKLILSREIRDNHFLNDSMTIKSNLIIGREYVLTVNGNQTLHVRSGEALITHKKGNEWLLVPVANSVKVVLSKQENGTGNALITLGDCIYRPYLQGSKVVFTNMDNEHIRLLTVFYETAVSAACTDVSVTDCTGKVSAYRSTNPNQPIAIADLPYEETMKYNILIRLCIDSGCLKEIKSPDFQFETKGASGMLQMAELSTSGTNHCVRVSLRWKEFSAKSGISFYQWTISDDNEARHALTRWKTITDVTQYLYQVNECATLPILPHEGMFACVRAYTKANNNKIVCRRIRLIFDADYSITSLFDFDSSSAAWNTIQETLHSSSVGKIVSLLHQSELDVGNKMTKVTGALLHASDRNVTWYLMKTQHVPQSCNLDSGCLYSQITNTGYVNIKQNLLTSRQHYFICGQSDATVTERESSREVFEELTVCSDGFIIDDTKPTDGQVYVNNHNGYIIDTDTLFVNWAGVNEDVDLTSMGYMNPVKEYKVGIGRRPGDDSFTNFKNIGQVSSTVIENATLSNGDIFYVSVMATNYAGLSTTISTHELKVDATQPLTGYIVFMEESIILQDAAVVSNKYISLRLVNFEDAESGIEYYFIGVGSRSDIFDVRPKEKHGIGSVDVTTSGKGLVDGAEYFILVQAVNRAGLESAIVSKKFIIDKTPPIGGHVMDGEWSYEEDVDYQADIDHISGHWKGFIDIESGILSYKVGFGTRAFVTDTEDFVDIGLKTDITWYSSVTPGQKYYITVKACNGAGLCRMLSSDGIILDNSPPIGGLVYVGSHGNYQSYLPQTSSVYIKWLGFEDPQSGIDHFESCIGSRPYICDLYQFDDHLLSSSVTRTSLDLKENIDLYVTVKAVSKVGMLVLRASKPFRVDISPPTIVSKPSFIVSHTNKPGFPVHFERSVLQIKWKFAEDHSPIIRHTISLLTHHEGHTPIENMELGAENNLTLNMDGKHWLHDGDRYYVKVTCCNAADICTTALSDDILIDSTPPYMGGFKPPLLWKSQIGKEGVVTGSLGLTWYGFLDNESGVRIYYIKVGTAYGGEELSNGTISYNVTTNATEQYHTVQLIKTLSENDDVFLAIWADNFAGLNSSVARVKVKAISKGSGEGVLEIEKHSCSAEYCTGDCTCAVIGKTCLVEKARQCHSVDLSKENGYPEVNIITGQRSSPRTITPSSSCLAAHWNITTANNNKTILRYEWSMGITGERPGEGVFDSSEIPWKDTGMVTEIIHCLRHGFSLTHGERYTTHVRAWFGRDEYADYQSESIIIDQTAPAVSKRNHIFDSDVTCAKDLDYIDWMDTITACWHTVFSDTESSISYYTAALGTLPLADDVLATTRTDLDTNITLTNIGLEHGVKYYFTITAYNNVGLSTRKISDGFAVDMDNPISGIVFNTKRHFDTRFQSDINMLSFSWHGFIDHYSGIKSYLVAFSEKDQQNISDIQFINVGLNIMHTFKTKLLKHNDVYIGLVKAVDAAGHESNIVMSAEKVIDTTAPEGKACVEYALIHTISELVEHTEHVISFVNAFEINKIYKLSGFILATNSVISAEMLLGRIRQKLDFTINHNGTRQLEVTFISSLSGQQNLSVKFYQAKGIKINVTLWACQSSSKNAGNSSVIVRQVSMHKFRLDMLILDPESNLYQVQVGAGTTPGSFQIQKLTTPATDCSHSIITRAPHGSRIWVTVIAENHAGLRSSFRGKPITIDHTGPVIDKLEIATEFIDLNNTKYTMGRQCRLKANWSVSDDESAVKSCYCEFGHDTTVSHQYIAADTLNSCVSEVFALKHGMKAFVTVLCLNDVELATERTSNITIALDRPSNAEAHMWFVRQHRSDSTHDVVKTAITLPDTTIVSIQSDCTCLNFEWTGFYDSIGIQYYEYRVLCNESSILDWTHADSIQTYGSTCRMGHLLSEKVYTVHVRAVNDIQETSEVIEANILVECNRPQLQQASMQITQNEYGTLEIDWAKSFATHPYFNLTYSLMVGSRRGYSDIADVRYMDKTTTTVATEDLDEVFVILVGYYPTGASGRLETNIRL